jgi:hypothetical protein
MQISNKFNFSTPYDAYAYPPRQTPRFKSLCNLLLLLRFTDAVNLNATSSSLCGHARNLILSLCSKLRT